VEGERNTGENLSFNFDGGVMAIWQALKELNKQHLAKKSVVLLIDSVAAIQAVANEESQDKKILQDLAKILQDLAKILASFLSRDIIPLSQNTYQSSS
jgi:hypothetical protein